MFKIKQIETQHNENIKKVTEKLNNLNAKVSQVVNINNEISVKNIKSLLTKLDTIETVSETNDAKMMIELENLKSKLTFLMENSEVYALTTKKDESKKSKD